MRLTSGLPSRADRRGAHVACRALLIASALMGVLPTTMGAVEIGVQILDAYVESIPSFFVLPGSQCRTGTVSFAELSERCADEDGCTGLWRPPTRRCW